MPQTLSVSAAASFIRLIIEPKTTNVLEYHIKGLIHVRKGDAPVTGLSSGNFTVRIGGQNWGAVNIAAHPESDKFPGIYTFALNVTHHLSAIGGFDWLTIFGEVLAVRVDSGSDYGLAVASLSQVETSSS